MTPIEQLVRVAEDRGLKPVERRVGTEGACKIFAFSKPMPKSVRELGCNMNGLDYHYWMAGDEGLKEGFGDFERGEDIHFPAALLSARRLKFYRRKYKLQWQSWQDDRLVTKLKRRWRKPDTPRVHLDSDIIGPDTDEYQKIEAASALVSEKITKAAVEHGCKLYWSYGDSRAWRVIIAITTEAELKKFALGAANVNFARWLIQLIGSVVDLDEDFKLYMEIDSDERVNAAEGWFFRIKSDPQPGRELMFELKGNSLSEPPNDALDSDI